MGKCDLFEEQFWGLLEPIWDCFLSKLKSVRVREKCPSTLQTLLESHTQGSLQHYLSDLLFESNFDVPLKEILSPRERLRLLAVSRPKAATWLQALPSRSLNLELDHNAFSILLRWWLGVPVFDFHDSNRLQCPEFCKSSPSSSSSVGFPPVPKQCSGTLDSFGDHAVTCHTGPSLIARHNEVNFTWYNLLRSFGWNCRLEQRCDPESHDRQADTFVYRWVNLINYAHDWTITHTLRERFVNALERPCHESDLSGYNPDKALLEAEQAKLNSVTLERGRPGFLPLAADTFGGFGPLAWDAFKLLHKKIVGLQPSFTFTRLIQVLQTSVLRGVAEQLLRRRLAIVPDEILDPVPETVSNVRWAPSLLVSAPRVSLPCSRDDSLSADFVSVTPSPAPRPLILPASSLLLIPHLPSLLLFFLPLWLIDRA